MFLTKVGRICHELLNLSKGLDTEKKRCFDVEPVFANIKQNHGFRRFALRGVKQKLK
uniref:transposase n=1 Tax=Pedobacter antarcticus TaxID=34086 RepID=UPI003744AB2C